MKYLLSTGRSTNSTPEYIADLFRLHLEIYPREIPGLPGMGFDFLLTDTTKDNLLEEVRTRVRDLVAKFQQKFSGINFSVDSITLLTEAKVKIVITINGLTQEYEVNTGLR